MGLHHSFDEGGPVLVVPPSRMPITVEEVRSNLPASDLSDVVIEGLIASAVSYLDGWTGILGRCLVEQEWQQTFNCTTRVLPLLLLPVLEISKIEIETAQGEKIILNPNQYRFRSDRGGMTQVLLKSDVNITGDISVLYKAGYRTIPAIDGPPVVAERSTVPEAIKMAILLMVHEMKSLMDRDLFETQESVVGVGTLTRSVSVDASKSISDGVKRLLSGYKVMRI